MENKDDVLKMYSDGPDFQESTRQYSIKNRIRRSKLQSYSEYIFKLRTEKKSYQFISDRLKKMGVECNRSTLYRFYKKLISL